MDILTIAYSFSGLIFGAAFIPQIITLLKESGSVESINIATWALFSFCSAINFLYALMHNGDSYFIFCSIIGLLGNLSILLLVCLHRLPAKFKPQMLRV